jgi:hypothetical protein
MPALAPPDSPLGGNEFGEVDVADCDEKVVVDADVDVAVAVWYRLRSVAWASTTTG